MKTKTHRYLVRSLDGTLEETSPFAAHWHTDGRCKADATAKLVAFAARVLDEPPCLTFRNGAWQLVSPSLLGGYDVCSGEIGRSAPLCSQYVPSKLHISDATASFSYYSSPDYQLALRQLSPA